MREEKVMHVLNVALGSAKLVCLLTDMGYFYAYFIVVQHIDQSNKVTLVVNEL